MTTITGYHAKHYSYQLQALVLGDGIRTHSAACAFGDEISRDPNMEHAVIKKKIFTLQLTVASEVAAAPVSRGNGRQRSTRGGTFTMKTTVCLQRTSRNYQKQQQQQY